jgi:SAM-dependent methyltransferase
MIKQECGGEYTKGDYERLKMVAELCTGNVLDVGCGNGKLKDYLAKDCEYVGIDVLPSGNGVYGSAYKLDYFHQAFDTVTLLEVLEHLEHPLDALLEIRRVVKKKLIISVPNPYNMDQIASILHNKINIENPNHITLFGDNEIKNLCFAAGFMFVKPIRFYTKIPGLNWLSPIKSCFGEWSIYEVT